MTLKSLFRPLLLAITLLPLSACSALVGPKDLTIEYDEEVKLHDGEMIWVHITRHYFLTGGALGDSATLSSNYLPSDVEISWDTGFEGVGRKSVYFNGISFITKYDNKWYVGGSKYNGAINNTQSINCSSVGVQVGQHDGCMVAVNNQGKFIQVNSDDIYNFNVGNLLYPVGIKDWGSVPKPLNGKQLSWKEKLILQSSQTEKRQRIGKILIKSEKQK